MWQLVVFPVFGVLFAAFLIFLFFGPAISAWFKSLHEQTQDTVEDIQDQWKE